MLQHYQPVVEFFGRPARLFQPLITRSCREICSLSSFSIINPTESSRSDDDLILISPDETRTGMLPAWCVVRGACCCEGDPSSLAVGRTMLIKRTA